MIVPLSDSIVNYRREKEDMTIPNILKRLHVTLEHEMELMKHQLNCNGIKAADGHASFSDRHCYGSCGKMKHTVQTVILYAPAKVLRALPETSQQYLREAPTGLVNFLILATHHHNHTSRSWPKSHR